jgi:ABC-2 type transport system ATP-binding protein
MLRYTFGVNASVHDGKITFRTPDADRLLPAMLTRLDVEICSVSVHRPTMNDIFLDLTGHADES